MANPWPAGWVLPLTHSASNGDMAARGNTLADTAPEMAGGLLIRATRVAAALLSVAARRKQWAELRRTRADDAYLLSAWF